MPSVTSEKYRWCQARFDRQYPEFRNAGQLYQELAGAHIDVHTRVLDLGCGRSSLAAPQMNVAHCTAGIDRSLVDLQGNHSVRHPILGGAERLPFAAASLDVVLSQWVVEHLARPDAVFAEVARVLRPGGAFILLTTNARNYVPLVSRLVPAQVQGGLLESLIGRPQHESFPTHYRANTCRALSRLAGRVGLTMAQCTYVGNPFYLAFSRPLFLGALLFERLTDPPPLRGLKLYIVAVLGKPIADR